MELCVFEYPGHGNHKAELFEDADALMKQFDFDIIQSMGGMSEWFSFPFALLGESTGARFAFGFLSEMHRISVRPEKLYVVARTPPIVPDYKWVDEQPEGTIEMLDWVSEQLVTSQAERLKKAWRMLPKKEAVKREEIWRSDLRLNCGRIRPLPRTWRVVEAEGKIIKKASPESQKIISGKREPGCLVHTTGRQFIGPSGGKWVELDPKRDPKPGWLLTHGRTIGLDSELLEAVEEERPVDASDVFWKAPVGIQVHWSTGDDKAPWQDPAGRLAPMQDWAKLCGPEPEFVKYDGLLHDELLMHEQVIRHICSDLLRLLKIRH